MDFVILGLSRNCIQPFSGQATPRNFSTYSKDLAFRTGGSSGILRMPAVLGTMIHRAYIKMQQFRNFLRLDCGHVLHQKPKNIQYTETEKYTTTKHIYQRVQYFQINQSLLAICFRFQTLGIDYRVFEYLLCLIWPFTPSLRVFQLLPQMFAEILVIISGDAPPNSAEHSAWVGAPGTTLWSDHWFNHPTGLPHVGP